ncbi:MAG: site-specific integrase [Chloroflexi bacterium]|nr:site-specific integrase [Chloroflexota bacterium]
MTNRPMRRAKGAGSIRQRGKGSWQIRYDGPPDANGKITKLSEAVRGSRRDAEKALRDRLGVVEDGSYVAKNKETTAEFLWRWIDTYAATNTSLRTQQGYKVNVRRVIAHIGAIPLQQLRPQHIQKMYADLVGRGLSAQTVNHTHRTLSEALGHGVQWGVLTRNVSSATSAPKPKRQQQQMWDVKTINRFLAVSQDNKYRDFYHLDILTGLRRSELAGLQWEYVDLPNAQLSVANTLQRIDGHGLVEGQPKTFLSRRLIAVSPRAVALLRSIHRNQLEQRLAVGPLWQDTGYVFTQANGSRIDPDKATRDFTRIVSKNGLPYLTLQGLRHAHATLLLAAGVHPKIVSERLGHSNIGITMDIYSHVMPGMQEAAAQSIDDTLAAEGEA